MNGRVLQSAGLALRMLPPRNDSRFLPAPSDYEDALSAIQRLRGALYVADGAIRSSTLDPKGRHQCEDDHLSYHLALWNGEVQGCARVRLHPPHKPAQDYRVHELIDRMHPRPSAEYRVALQEFISQSEKRGYRLGEVGGWAVSKSHQASRAAMALPLAGWSFSRICGKQIWIASATERNRSAEMLRRIGGWPLKLGGADLPPFFDSVYNCQMQLLCFCSDVLNPKFESAVAELQSLIELQFAANENPCRGVLSYEPRTSL